MGRTQSAAQQTLLVETSEWKQEASARLREHRSRRGHAPAEDAAALEAVPRTGRKAKIAQQVLERYARATSYAKYLEEITAVEAAPEAPAAPQPALFAPLPAEPVHPVHVHAAPEVEIVAADLQPVEETPLVGMCEEYVMPVSFALPAGTPGAPEPVALSVNRRTETEAAPDDLMQVIEPEAGIPANLIEFPRVLVSSRRARPRLAEGPLREPEAAAVDASQLRIFEAEPEEISIEPLAAAAHVEAPEWHDIRLNAPAVAAPERVSAADPSRVYERMPVAPLRRRAMAALVDLSLIGLGYSAFVAAFAVVAPSLPEGRTGVISAAAAFAVCFAIYHWMFANYATATPGMRYARIGLCTFRDANPTRRETRARTLAFFLSLVTLGFGIVWSVVDDERLGWHDRISRTFQRAY